MISLKATKRSPEVSFALLQGEAKVTLVLKQFPIESERMKMLCIVSGYHCGYKKTE